MQAIYNKETGIITRLIDTTDPSKFFLQNEDVKAVPYRNDLRVGEHINKFTNEGKLRPNSELLADGFITLEDDQKLDGEVIRDLTEEEKREKNPELYPTAEDIAIDEELQAIETEIKTMEDEALKSLIQKEINKEN